MWVSTLKGHEEVDAKVCAVFSKKIPKGYAVLPDGCFVQKFPEPTSVVESLRYKMTDRYALSSLPALSLDEGDYLPAALVDAWWPLVNSSTAGDSR